MDVTQASRVSSLNISRDHETASPISESFTESMINRLHSVMSTLGDANEDLSMLTDRMFGPAVQGATASGGGSPTSPARADILFEMVEQLQRRAASVTSLARGLNSRI